jgi:transposase
MYNLDTRVTAIVHYKHFCKSVRKISRIYGVSKSSVQRWVNQGLEKPQRNARHVPALADVVQNYIRQFVSANPFITSATLSERLKVDCGFSRSRRTISRYLSLLKFTRKKAYRVVDYQHSPENVAAFCADYLGCPSDHLISIDETAFYVGDHGAFGYSPKGCRLNVAFAKSLRRKKFTVVTAVTAKGIHHYQVIEGSCKKTDFIKFIETMPAVPKGTRLIMDNVQFHHSVQTKAAILEKGCEPLYVPPYSPKFNAIEQVFAAMKTAYRKDCPRCPADEDTAEAAIHATLTMFEHCDFSAYFQHTLRAVKDTAFALQHKIAWSGYDV